MLILVKVLTKYIIITYAFGSVHEKLGVSDLNQRRPKVPPYAKFPAGLGKNNG